MRYVDSVIELIGNTPLVRLNKVTEGIVPKDGPIVLAKVEYLNPGGSIKDRIAVRMIDAAEEEGLLAPGGTIVEPTSGNTGVGLAMVAQQRGYHCIFVCPDKVSEDKRNVLRAYGADVVVCRRQWIRKIPARTTRSATAWRERPRGAGSPINIPIRTILVPTTR